MGNRRRATAVITIGVLSAAAILGVPEARATGPVRVSVGDVTLVEGDSSSRTVRVMVRLSKALPTPTQIAYTTANRTATAPADYPAKSGTITIGAGKLAEFIGFNVNSDNVAELDEHFAVVLTGSLGAPLGRSTGAVTILDDDDRPTTRVTDAAGDEPEVFAGRRSISADGRHVAFDSFSSGLPPGGVYVHDLVTGTLTPAVVDQFGGPPDSVGHEATISADGRYVAFQTRASDLVPGDGNGIEDVYLRDLEAGTTRRVSVDTTGGDPDVGSFSPSISADGRYVAFNSAASDLVTGDGNGLADVFVRDLAAGTTTRVSVDMAGGDGNGHSTTASVSADGRHIAFHSAASDLVAGDGNATHDAFVRDLTTGTTTRVSVDTAGGDPNGQSIDPSISGNGRSVAFWSAASDLVPGDGNATHDAFVRDLTTGTTTRVSVDTSGGDGNGQSRVPALSADGRYVAFDSAASDLVAGDGNGFFDVFVRDLVTATTTRVSIDVTGGDPDAASTQSSISHNGRSVAFNSMASDLVPGDGNGFFDVFVHVVPFDDSPAERVSVDTLGGAADGNSFGASVSADRRYVAFSSAASDLVPGDGNGQSDVFIRDLLTGTTVRASVDVSGGDPNGPSALPSINADGRFVAFQSVAGDLIASDGNGVSDIFVRDLLLGTTTRASVDTAGGDPSGESREPSISADGSRVAFESLASDLVAGDGNGVKDVFVRNLTAATTTRVSVDTGGADANAQSSQPAISANGLFVAFASPASDLVAGDGNAVFDVFRRDLTGATTTRVSVDTSGTDPSSGSGGASISADGNYVAFESLASDLVGGDGNGHQDIFRRSISGSVTTRVSVDRFGGDANHFNFGAAISENGQFVTFGSRASDLVVADGNGLNDIFRRDLALGTTVRVNMDQFGGDTNDESSNPSISADGRYVAFPSTASDLVPGDGNGFDDVFVRDMAGVFASIGDAAAVEGDGGTNTVYFTFSIDRPAPTSVVATYTTVDRSATEPADYVAKVGTATITPGNKSVLIPITFRSDRLVEGDHRFSLELTAVTGARVVRAYGTGTVLDDDSP